MPELLEDATVEAIRIRAKWENDDYICRGHILNGMSGSLFDVYTNVELAKELWDSLGSKYMAEDSSSKKFLIDKLPPSWKDFKHTLKHGKDDLSLVQLGSHLRIEESLRRKTGDKGKTGHFKRDFRSGNKKNANVGGSGKGSMDHSQDQGQNLVPVWNSFVNYYVSLISEEFYVQVDAIAWWIESDATTHVCKDRCWFKTYEPVEDGSILYMGNDHFAPVHGKGSAVLEFSSGKSSTLFNVLYVPKLCKNLISGPVLNKCGYKQVYESDKYILSKSGVFVGFGYYNNGMFMLNLNNVSDDLDSVYMSFSSSVVNSSLWHAHFGHVHYKKMLEMSKDDLIPAIDENPKKCTTCMLTKITRQPFKSITRKSIILELIHSDLCDFYATPSLGNKKYVITFINDASRFCYVYLLHAKDEALDKFRIYKTEVELQQNDLIKTLCTDRGGEYYDLLFFQSVGIIHETTAPYTPQQNGVAKRKNRALKEMVNSMLSYSGLSEGFWGEAVLTACYLLNKGRCKASRPKVIIPNSVESQRDDHSDDVPSEIPEPRKDPRTYDEAMQSRDASFWKEAIDDEIGSIMENNTWVLSDLPPGCKPLGCKWIFKRKMKFDGTIDKFKARLINQGFRQKEGIDYFDTYVPVARITTIRLLLALAAIHNLVIHQMDVKTTFLNGDLDEEVYMKQPEGFVMPGNKHKVCKLVKSLYGLKQAPKQWHQKFDEVVLSSGFLLNQSDKCVYRKFNSSVEGVIICLYVDDMLIFGTDRNHVDKTKMFLSSKFSMKDMGEADIILDCSPVSTPMDLVEKLKPNTGKPVDQLEYSRVIRCLMYAMTSTRPDIAYIVGTILLLSYKGISCGVREASKKQTCIAGSTMESEFVALAAVGKEAEWLRNLIHEIPIWPKPIAPISIRVDSCSHQWLGL
ncbi:zinc finger, CCHC-type containing protein [Tanacetum coccineum]|uniref:Zinc finger, CCHC-type containing protein n=1 Tax=Tanacetum coccineum TaxID=301880 RepID=A0ABQ5AR09_9ASTR